LSAVYFIKMYLFKYTRIMTNLELENEFQELAVLAQDSLGNPIPHYLEPEFPAFLDSLEQDNPYLYQQLKAFHPDALLAREHPLLEGELDPLEDGPSRKGNIWRNLQRKIKDAAWWRPASFEASTKVLNKGRGNIVILTLALGLLGIYSWNYYAKSVSSLSTAKTAHSSGAGGTNGVSPSSSAEQLKNATSIPHAPSTTATTPTSSKSSSSPFPHTESNTSAPPPAFGVQPEMAQSSPRVVETSTPTRSSVFPLRRMDSPVTLTGVPRIQVQPSSELPGVFPSSGRAVKPVLGAAPAIIYQRSGQIGQTRANPQKQFLADSSKTFPKVTVLGKALRTSGVAYQRSVGKETGKETGKDSSLMYVSSKTNVISDTAPIIEPPPLTAANPVVYQGQNTARGDEVKVLYRSSAAPVPVAPVTEVHLPETPTSVPSTPSVAYQNKNTARGDETKVLYRRSSAAPVPVVQIPETPKPVSNAPITYQSKNAPRGNDAKVLFQSSSPVGDVGKSPTLPTRPPEVFGGGEVENEMPVPSSSSPAPTVVEPAPSSNAGVVYAGKNKTPSSQVLYSKKTPASKPTLTSTPASTAPSSASNPTPAIPGLEAGVSAIPSRLITALEVAYGDSKPVVAESDLGVWLGVATPNPQYGRMELRFDRLIQNGKVYPVIATGFDTAYQQGLEGRVQDSSKNILQDVARQSANALNIYAQQLAQSSNTAVLGNGAALQSKQAAPLQTILAGEIGKLLQLPEQQGGFYRTMRLERTTALYIMIGVGSGPSDGGVKP
jgi:hypothetical protein